MLILISFKNLAVGRMLKGNFLNIVGIIPHSTVCPKYLPCFKVCAFLLYFFSSPTTPRKENNAEDTYFLKYSNEVSGDSRSSMP